MVDRGNGSVGVLVVVMATTSGTSGSDSGSGTTASESVHEGWLGSGGSHGGASWTGSVVSSSEWHFGRLFW